MTLKQNSKKVLDIYAAQVKKNATQAYKEVHPTTGANTARSNVHKLLKKPEAQIYLQKHIDKATITIVELLDDEKSDIKLKAAQDVLDRTHGKATTKTEVTSVGVVFSEHNLKLSEDFTAFLKQKTYKDSLNK